MDDDFLIFDVLSPPKLGWATSHPPAHPLPMALKKSEENFEIKNNSSFDRVTEEQVYKRKPTESTGLLRIGFNKAVFKNQPKCQLTSKPSDNTWH